ARDAYASAIAFFEKQTPDSKRQTAEWQDRLIKLHERLGKVEAGIGSSEALRSARDHYEKGLQLTRRQAQEDPDNDTAKGKISDFLDFLGDLEKRIGETEKAYEYYSQALANDRDRAAKQPESWAAKGSIVYSAVALLPVSRDLGKTEESAKLFAECLKLCDELGGSTEAWV